MQIIHQYEGLRMLLEIKDDKDLMSYVNFMEKKSCPYIILQKNENEYMQCMGSRNQFTVEQRRLSDDEAIHSRLGTAAKVTSLQTVNSALDRIDIYIEEVVTLDQVKELFLAYYQGKNTPPQFHHRKLDASYN